MSEIAPEMPPNLDKRFVVVFDFDDGQGAKWPQAFIVDSATKRDAILEAQERLSGRHLRWVAGTRIIKYDRMDTI